MPNDIMTTMPVAPVTTNGNSNGMFGDGAGSWIWILLIFMLLGRGNLFGNGDVAATPAANMLNNDFLYTQQKIDALGQAIINQTNQINQTLNSGFATVNQGICGLGHQLDLGFCSVNSNLLQQTMALQAAMAQGFQGVMNLINNNTMQDLRDRNTALEAANNNAQQTNAIINAIRPYPAPAFVTAPPGAPYFG